ncbi:UNVERIFIED_CONTAM: phosphatidylinositol-4-phosphate 5-kinase [Hammondia hammondi]|eukprot:XP_008888837.1 phosphatidylinositol-4-phosphate 5-kinase [Hammondia hammondi]
MRTCCGRTQATRRSAGDVSPSDEVAKSPLGFTHTLQGHARLPAKMERTLLEDILTKTNLGPKEIKDLYNRFRKIAPDGSLPFSRFCDTLGVLGMVDETFLAERLFNAFDTNGDSRLSFTEFAVALGTMMRGSDDEKLNLSFKILNPTYGGGATCLADYGLGGFEEEASEWEQTSVASARAGGLREPSLPSPSSWLPELLSLQRYEELKPQIERDTIGAEDFVLLIHCVEQTRSALIGGTQPSSSDAEIRRVFVQNATLMPDGTSRMMLLDFKQAVRTSPAFLALLGVLPQELAADTSAGHQCIPAAKKAVSMQASRRRHSDAQSSADSRSESRRDSVEAVKQELQRVREELGRVVEFVNSVVSVVQKEQDTSDAIIAHVIKDAEEDAAHLADGTAAACTVSDAGGGLPEKSEFSRMIACPVRSLEEFVPLSASSCPSIEEIQPFPSFPVRSMNEVEREDRASRVVSRKLSGETAEVPTTPLTSKVDGTFASSAPRPSEAVESVREDEASTQRRSQAREETSATRESEGREEPWSGGAPSKREVSGVRESQGSEEAAAACELSHETHAHLRRTLEQLHALRTATVKDAVEAEANKTISQIEAVEARIGRLLSLLRDDDRASLSSAGATSNEKEGRKSTRLTACEPPLLSATNGDRGSVGVSGNCGSSSFDSRGQGPSCRPRGLAALEVGREEGEGGGRGEAGGEDGETGREFGNAVSEPGAREAEAEPLFLGDGKVQRGSAGSEPEETDAKGEETRFGAARGPEGDVRDGEKVRPPACRKHGLGGSKYRSFTSKKVTIRLRSAETTQRQATTDEHNDRDALSAHPVLGTACSRPLHKDSGSQSEEIPLHRMYMNRANFKFSNRQRRRRRSILPMGSFRLKRVDSNSSRPPGSPKGLAVHFGHENWDTVINIMVGIRLAAGRASSEPQRAIERYDFVMKEKFSILPNTGMVKSISDRRSLFAVRFVDYAPMVFRRLRERFHISSETYVRSVGPEQLLGNLLLGNLSSLSELVSEGRSGALFYYTADGKFMIKTISKSTAMFLRSILLDYYEHVMANPDSLLTRFFGLHAIRLKEKHRSGGAVLSPHIAADRRMHKKYFIVMSNFFHTPVEIHRRYDLKGSTYKRQLPPDQLKDSTIALKDLDIDRENEKMELGPERRSQVLAQMQKDVEFLRAHQIIDYSLLLGIFYRGQEPDDVLAAMVSSTPTPPPPRPLSFHHNFRLHHLSGLSQPSMEPHVPFFQAEFGGMWSADKSKLYYVGIVDILTYWNTIKKLEHAFKTVQTGDPKSISCVNPDYYAERFMAFMRRHIE